MAKAPKVKFKLGDRPETFPSISVSFKTNRGTQAEIDVVFVYRTRAEFGAAVGEHFGQVADELPRDKDGRVDFKEMANQSTDNDASYLMSAMRSWDLDDELTQKTLQKMADEHPAAVVALKAAYAAACNEGRLGN